MYFSHSKQPTQIINSQENDSLLKDVVYTRIQSSDPQVVSMCLRFVQDIKIIFKYKDCLKVLRIVICKYKDLVVVWVLSFKETLF